MNKRQNDLKLYLLKLFALNSIYNHYLYLKHTKDLILKNKNKLF